MTLIIAIAISLLIVLLAFLVKYFATSVAESDHHFWWVLTVFFVVYGIAAVALSYLLPRPPTPSVNTVPETETIVRLSDV